MCTCYPIINRVSELKVHIELTCFVQPEKTEIDANERAVNEKSQYCFFVCTTFDSFLNDLTGEKCYMSGCNGMLPAMFDVQPVARKNKIHQSELPVQLCEEILEYVTYEGEIILDSFAGSGAVGVAALNKKRSCILIEILKENIEKIRTRFNSVLYQTVLE